MARAPSPCQGAPSRLSGPCPSPGRGSCRSRVAIRISVSVAGTVPILEAAPLDAASRIAGLAAPSPTPRAAGGGRQAGPQPSAPALTHTSACVSAPAPASAGRGGSVSGDTATGREASAASVAPRKSAVSSIYLPLSPSLSLLVPARARPPPVGGGAPRAARRPNRPTEIPATGRNVPTNSTAPTEREQTHPFRDTPSRPPIRSQLPA